MTTARRILCIGGGAAGLYFALLAKKADPSRTVRVVERNRPYDTFGWGVVFSDQTLGMVAWRLRLERVDGSLPRWPDVPKRLAAATLSLLPAGLGWWWMLVDRERLAWHDRLSGTRIVLTPPRGR